MNIDAPRLDLIRPYAKRTAVRRKPFRLDKSFQVASCCVATQIDMRHDIRRDNGMAQCDGESHDLPVNHR